MILRRHNFVLLILMTIIFSSCGPPEVEKLEEEVLALHDEVMPWLDDMKAKRRQLARLTNADSVRITQTKALLSAADSLMWAWMYRYKSVASLEDSLSDTQLTTYLRSQRESIQHVNMVTKKAMAEANELLAGLQLKVKEDDKKIE